LREFVDKQRLLIGVIVFLLLAAFLWTTRDILSPLLTGAVLIFVLLGVKRYPMARRLLGVVVVILLVWFLIRFQGVLFPFFAAFALAYLFDPLADKLERARIPRTLATLIIILAAFGLLVLFGAIIIPNVVQEIQDLIGQVPRLAEVTYNLIRDNLPRVLEILHVESSELEQSLLEEIPNRAEQVLSNLLKGVTGIGSFLGKLINLVLIPILAFYLLKDFDRIRGLIFNFLPAKYRSLAHFYLWRMNRIFGGYLRGQLIICTIVGFLTGLGLAMFRIPFAVLVGFMTGILNIIPYLGLYVSLAIALLTSFFTPDVFPAMIKIAGVFFLVQALEAYVFSPKILGDRVGLHPVAVIFAILVFSRLLGFWGLIIAVPTTALLKFFIDEWNRRRKWKEIIAEKSVVKDNPG
jgi:predicted PurR-regulated permease PerM